MNLGEIAMLRTKLRELNIEYSALVRSKTGEGGLVRMAKLRLERRGLMALISFQHRLPNSREVAPANLTGERP